MPKPISKKRLLEISRALIASDPETWGAFPTDKPIPDLHRILFLRQAWALVLDEDNTQWIDNEVRRAEKAPDEPYAGIGHALKRCLECGVEPQVLTDLVRGNQADLLFSLCYLLEDPGFDEEELEDIGWSLVQTNEDLDPTTETINGLHEFILSTDPTGREMRPRK